MRKRLLVLPVVAVLLAGLAACSPGTSTDAKPTASASASASATSGTTVQAGTCSYPAAGASKKPVSAPSSEPELAKTATLTTSAGDITIALDGDKTPCTVNSFVSLISQGYFDGTDCHRLTTDGIFVLQCGDPTGTGTGGPGYTFKDETTPDMSYPVGTVAMANAGPNTNGSQFFLVYGDSSVLSPDYTVFGQMDEASVAVVQAIAAKGLAANGVAPAEKVTITTATATL